MRFELQKRCLAAVVALGGLVVIAVPRDRRQQLERCEGRVEKGLTVEAPRKHVESSTICAVYDSQQTMSNAAVRKWEAWCPSLEPRLSLSSENQPAAGVSHSAGCGADVEWSRPRSAAARQCTAAFSMHPRASYISATRT